jgi:heterodisulfide reductase subunit B
MTNGYQSISVILDLVLPALSLDFHQMSCRYLGSNRKDLGDYIIFMCPLCQVHLDLKEKD